jgi:hypothetical protein
MGDLVLFDEANERRVDEVMHRYTSGETIEDADLFGCEAVPALRDGQNQYLHHSTCLRSRRYCRFLAQYS